MNHRLHDDEISIETDLVRRLVDAQFPQYASMPLRRLDNTGSTNALFRLGADLLVRLPRQPGGSVAIDKEERWLPEIGQELPVAVPEIMAVGEPAFEFGERWSILRWLDGDLATACALDAPPTLDRSTLATDLADVILALRAIKVPGAAINDPALRAYRGRPLAEFDEQMRFNIEQCRSLADLDLDLDAALAIWEQALKLPGASASSTDRWYHGDLVAENLLLAEGRLSAVLDFGGLGVGDPTIDLHGAWELLDPCALKLFRTRLGVDEAEWLRGRAWALGIALGTFPYYWSTMPGRREDRLVMAQSVLADEIEG